MDLFSGIGGFSLGLKRAGGFRTVAYCEIDPYCQKVLQARMFDGSLDTAPICRDVRALDGRALTGIVDVICGGFPCQDISIVGKRVGIDGERSGLWREIARLVREIRPRYVFVENVAALLTRGIERVLGDLASSGYDAEWDVIPARAVGAPHLRERVWIVAYPGSGRGSEDDVRPGRYASRVRGQALGDSASERLQDGAIFQVGRQEAQPQPERSGWWATEPAVGRVAHGVPSRVDRLSALGNAVVPQVVEWIGRRIGRHES